MEAWLQDDSMHMKETSLSDQQEHEKIAKAKLNVRLERR